MLETAIKELTEEVRTLRHVMETLRNISASDAESLAKATAKKPEAEPMPSEAEIEAAVEEAKADAPKTEVPKREDLQAMCLKMVREDRSKKASIKSALAVYDAKVMADVPEDKLAELKTALEAL